MRSMTDEGARGMRKKSASGDERPARPLIRPASWATFSRKGRRTQKSRRAGSPGDGGLQLFLMRPHAGGDQLRSLPGVAPALDRD